MPEQPGEANHPKRVKTPKTIGVLEVWGAGPHPRQLLLQEGGRERRPPLETRKKTSETHGNSKEVPNGD
jgi:hypothetical protein